MLTAGTRQGVWYRQDWAKASGLPPSWVDGFIELPVTKQPAAACAVIRPEDKILFNNCLTIMGVLQALQTCEESSTCPEMPLRLYVSPWFSLQSRSRMLHRHRWKPHCLPTQYTVGNFASEEEVTVG